MSEQVTSTVEDYVKRIFLEQQEAAEGAAVPMGRVAALAGVAPGTTTSMIKSLADSGLAVYEPRVGVRLSEEGERLALHVLRKHRLIELFLVQVLGVDWAEVNAEAERLEHAVSDRLLERIDAHLGHPRVDPHGDPIPQAGGAYHAPALENLATCPLGRTLRVARVVLQEPAFLRFLHEHGLRPGQELTVAERSEAAESVVLRVAGAAAPLALGLGAARHILVR